jgi:pimeloyl-ACP methyl ester carboxylesterase
MEHRGGLRRIGVGVLGEAASVARCAAHYPLGMAEAALTLGRPSGDPGFDTPVLLVHGYAHNRSGWWVLQRKLRLAGFTSVHTVNYLPLGSGVPRLALRLADRVDEIRAATGARRVHLVGHSLGGVLIRWYVDQLGGDQWVDTAVTLGTPHHGTRLAGIALERTAQDLRPESTVMRRLARAGSVGTVRWVAYQGGADVFVPVASGRLDAAANVVNVLVPAVGHLGLLVSPEVAASVVHQLQAAEGAMGRLSPMDSASPVVQPFLSGVQASSNRFS